MFKKKLPFSLDLSSSFTDTKHYFKDYVIQVKSKFMGSNFPSYSVTVGKIFHCLFFSYRVLDYFSYWYDCKTIEDGSRTKEQVGD